MALFMANMWDELLGSTGLALLQERYGAVYGNWLTGRHEARQPRPGDVVVLAPSTMDSAVEPAAAAKRARTLLAWVLFPDQVIGWDFGRGSYRYALNPVLSETLIAADGIAANSYYTKAQLTHVGVTQRVDVVPLSVDARAISAHALRQRRCNHAPHIFWAQMWRT